MAIQISQKKKTLFNSFFRKRTIRRLRAQFESPIVATQDDRRFLLLILLLLLDGTVSGVFVNQVSRRARNAQNPKPKSTPGSSTRCDLDLIYV